MGYSDAIQFIRILENSIRMPKRAFEYAGIQSLGCWAEGIRMLRGGIWMLEVVFGCPRGPFGYAGYKARLLKRRVSGYPMMVFGC